MRGLALAFLAGAAGFALARRGGAVRVVRISRMVSDLGRAEAFYGEALGFRRVGSGPFDAAPLGLAGGSATETVLQLGDEQIALVCFDPPGPAYPPDSRSDDAWFQHLAIVVDDMDAAYRQLSGHAFRPISTDGPQLLPPRNGSVRAFKFRDPDGHPLELIQFPPGQGRSVWQGSAGGPFLGIDHSAMAVLQTARSVRFYRRLGFAIAARSLNYGPAQARLDGLAGARVRVTGLRPGGATGPGLELLGYRPAGRPMPAHAVDAVVTDWMTVQTDALPPGRSSLHRDPDGHLVLLTGTQDAPATSRRRRSVR